MVFLWFTYILLISSHLKKHHRLSASQEFRGRSGEHRYAPNRTHKIGHGHGHWNNVIIAQSHVDCKPLTTFCPWPPQLYWLFFPSHTFKTFKPGSWFQPLWKSMTISVDLFLPKIIWTTFWETSLGIKIIWNTYMNNKNMFWTTNQKQISQYTLW